MSYIMWALAWILDLCYSIVQNYGVAIILFTILTKAILLPLTIKQQKSMVKTQKLQPLLAQVQQKYANDKEKLNLETMKLYQKYKINPMSGCLPLLIQLPILMALYWVVKQPIIYIMGVDGADIWRLTHAIAEWGQTHQDALNSLFASLNIESFQPFYDDQFRSFGMYEIQIARFLNAYPEIMQNHWITETGEVYRTLNFDFLWIDLSQTPSLGALFGIFTGNVSNLNLETCLLWIIPVLSGVSAFVSSKLSQAMSPQQPVQKDEYGNEKKNPMQSVMVIMPLFSAWIAFSVPAAVGLYWIVSNLLQMLQQVLVTKFIKVDITDEQIEGEIVNAKKNRKKRKKR